MVVRQTNVGSTVRPFFGVALGTIGAVATIGTVAGFFGNVWWGFDLLANLRFPMGVVLLALAVIYGLAFGRTGTVVFILAAIVNLLLVAPLWLETQAPVASEDRLRVLAFDVSENSSGRGQVLSWLATTDADVIILQRTTSAWTELIADNSISVDYQLVIVPEQGTSGITVLSRVAATAESIAQDLGTQTLVEIRTSLGSRPVTILGARVDSPSSTRESDAQRELFTSIAERSAAAADSGERILVIGNLGTSRWTKAFEILTTDGGLVNSDGGFGYAGTWPSFDIPLIGPYLGIPIDQALMSPQLTAADRVVGPALGPSHRPLIVDLAPAGT